MRSKNKNEIRDSISFHRKHDSMNQQSSQMQLLRTTNRQVMVFYMIVEFVVSITSILYQNYGHYKLKFFLLHDKLVL